MHSYSIQLRVSGIDVDPESVTNFLELPPSLSRLKGEKRGQNSVWTESLWSYGGKYCEVTREWKSLEEGLLELMEELWPKRDLICSLAKKSDVIWWCGHFQSSFDGGPTFSIVLMRRLAEFGVPLYLDNYFRSEEKDLGGDIN
ncbi:DUF4279 domain-containing protein [Dyella acidisoli]|uniref:DUF4279 domain-containing protein n=1 Tax=Dyella acidisoli TaxID=1867834 RepID=A0ABQ5XW27_9GAMM|nr:DUF4279 domain-containing protein [Dyella acidisoli]GLQ95532.1 hypothetical protein GCM10007901_44880 [Dyella acidisoli]